LVWIASQRSRNKKQEWLSYLEQRVETLTTENQELIRKLLKAQEQILELQEKEKTYERSILQLTLKETEKASGFEFIDTDGLVGDYNDQRLLCTLRNNSFLCANTPEENWLGDQQG
jgi:hypothetical protein